MKKPVRLLLIAAGLLIALLLVAVGLALHSGVQTWAARRALNSQAGLKSRLGLLNAGFQNVDLADLQLEQNGALITLPSFHAELSVIDAGINEKVNIRKLVAKGWTLDLRKFKVDAAAGKTVMNGVAPLRSRAPFSLIPTAYAADPAGIAPAAAQVFQGIFAQTTLPVELSLDGVELEGDVLLPPTEGVETGRAHVTITGGGFAAGHEGTLTFAVAVSLAGSDVPVNSLTVEGRLAATMDTPRTFSRLATKADASASGPKFQHTVRLSAETVATRDAGGENYTVTVTGDSRQLVGLQAAFPLATRKLSGTWKLDVGDSDLAPFTLGRALPVFTAMGQGRFDTDPVTGETRASGKLNATADRLSVVKPELRAVGAVKLTAEFDLARRHDPARGDILRVERLSCTLAGAQPVLHVQSLQAFEFNPETKDLWVADSSHELLDLVLDGVPLAWANPFLDPLVVTGGDLRGEFLASARDSGATLRPKGPLVAAGVSITQAGKPVLSGVDLTVSASADSTPHGWQFEMAPLSLRHGTANLAELEVKVGQLVGKDQSIKAAGKFSVGLPELLAQPFASGAPLMAGGDVTGTFGASLDAQQGKQVEATLTVAHLVADPRATTLKLPTLSADIRANIPAKGGPIVVRLPLVVELDGRKSDLTISGTVTPGTTSLGLNAQLDSNLLVVSDVMLLIPAGPAPTTETSPASGAAHSGSAPAVVMAPWAGITGQVSVALKKVVYADSFEASNVTGKLTLDPSLVKFTSGSAGLGDGSDAKISGSVGFDGKAAGSFTLAADLAINEFNPAPLFRALNPSQPPTVEGKFSVTSKIAGKAASLADLGAVAHGDFQLTSKGGIFRGMPANVSSKAETVGKVAAGLSSIGNAFGAITGKKEANDIASKAQAVAEICKLICPIQYDQINVVVSRDESLNTVMKDFTLLAPEVRLNGGGQVTYKPGVKLLDQGLTMDYKLRARGHTADILKYLGKLDAQPDELGYAGCTIPLHVGGTLAQPDTSEINSALASLAIEKSGVLDKAGDLLNMFGGKK